MKRNLWATFIIIVLVIFASSSIALAEGNTRSQAATPTPTQSATKQNKEGLKLAKQFKVSYEEIIAWRDKGYGFGEIKIAYTLLAATADQGTTIAAIFDLRAQGKGWGQIAKSYGVKVNGSTVVKDPKPEKDNKEIKDKDNGKGNNKSGGKH